MILLFFPHRAPRSVGALALLFSAVDFLSSLALSILGFPVFPLPVSGIFGLIFLFLAWYGAILTAIWLQDFTNKIPFATFIVFALLLARHYPIVLVWYPIVFIFTLSALTNKLELSIYSSQEEQNNG